jgi:hypothetical protein
VKYLASEEEVKPTTITAALRRSFEMAASGNVMLESLIM